MSSIVIGKSGHKNVSIDVGELLRSRFLLTANSGGGKSWLLRKMVEELCGKVQVIIVDPEGEFATLREKFDFLLVGAGGELSADPRHAAVVAEKLMELRVSAVCDLFESFRKTPSERHVWMQNFGNALLDCPKKFWHPVVVVIDEFHKFCPERGAGESVASEAVIGLGTAGRKRGICLGGSTQRLGKVRKDVTAELLNRFVGPTFEDVDVERAADLLSVAKEDKKDFYAEMRTLEPGNFYCFGRAVSKVRILAKIGPVRTSHPEMGKSATEPPPPLDRVKSLLPKLADLPKQAEEKAKSIADFKSEIRSLKAKLAGTQPARIEVRQPFTVGDPKAVERAVAPLRKALEDAMKIIVKVEAFGTLAHLKDEDLTKLLESVKNEVKKLAADKLASSQREIATLQREAKQMSARLKALLVDTQKNKIEIDVRATSPRDQREVPAAPQKIEGVGYAHAAPAGNGVLGEPHKKILKAMAELRSIGKDTPSREEVAGWSGYSPNSGGFNNPLGYLNKTLRYISYPRQGFVALTEEGALHAGTSEPPDEQVLRRRMDRVLSGPEKKILDVLLEARGETLSREQLAEKSGYSATSGGFNNPLGSLRSKGFIEYPSQGNVKACSWLFLD